jgi:hypothetical protein
MPWTYDVSVLAADADESDGSDTDDTTTGDAAMTGDEPAPVDDEPAPVDDVPSVERTEG